MEAADSALLRTNALSVEQTVLELFAARTFEQLCSDMNLSAVIVHCVARLKSGWYVKIHRENGLHELFVPNYLQEAPEPIKTALLEWAVLARPKRTDRKMTVRERRHVLEETIRAYIKDHAPATTSSSHRTAPFTQKWPTMGCRYDLREVFNNVNHKWFDGSLESVLRWGRPGSKTSYQSTRRGTAGTLSHCITIAGIYNRPDVPEFAMESIMYHEMLHIAIPPRRERGRNIIHGADFRKRERSFPHYEKWRQWERGVATSRHVTHTKARRRVKNVLQRITGLLTGIQPHRAFHFSPTYCAPCHAAHSYI